MWPFRRRNEDDFRQEIEGHIAIETDRLIAEGLSPEEARHVARRAFGNATVAQERFYESRRILWLDELSQDVRYAWRTLRRSPGFATVAIVTLTLGIGANTAIFSIINAVLLRPLPYRDPGSLILIETSPLAQSPGWLTAAWRERATAVTDLAGFNGPRAATLIAGGNQQPVQSAIVTPNFLSFLGLVPALGRDFAESDALPGAPPAALLSHDLWVTRFGGDSSVLGRTVVLSGRAITVIGIAPRHFRFPTAGLPLATALPVDTQPGVIGVGGSDVPFNVIGRLGPQSTPVAAQTELLGIFKQEAVSRFPRLVDRLQLSAGSLQTRLSSSVRQRLWLVMGAVVFVLLVACANVANLLLARSSTRQRELAVRSALGARKGRVVRLLLTESLLLGLLGSAGALLVTYLTSGVARTLLASRVPHVESIGIDWWVLGFNAAVAIVMGLLCGLVSVPGATRINPATTINDGGTSAVTGRSGIRRVLLAGEVAVTFVLVVGAALLAQTLWNLSVKERGFDASQLLTMRVAPGTPAGLDPADRRAPEKYFAAFFTDLTHQLSGVPGVASAAAVSTVPFAGTGVGMGGVVVEGQPAIAPDQALAPVAAVSPGYFRTMRISQLAGRDFDDRDRLGSEKVAIVNDAFRRRYAPNGDIVGSRIRSDNNAITIIGLVADVPERTLREPPEPLVFFALRQMPMHPFGWGQLRLVLRAPDGDPRRLAPAIRDRIWAIDPNIVVDEVATMDERVAVTIRAERDSAVLFGLFAATALMMAAIGAYGVAAYAAAQRTREIGVRIALGAERRDVRRLVVSQALKPTMIGIAIGAGAGTMLTRLIASMVFGVTPLDPATFATGASLLAGVALAATWIPARRASRVDPLIALRAD